MHEVGFEVTLAEVVWDVHPHHAPPFRPGLHPAHPVAAALCAATAATTAVVSASSSNVIPNVNPYLERLRLDSDRVHMALRPGDLGPQVKRRRIMQRSHLSQGSVWSGS
jgi:hypothetical protein